MTPEQHLDLLCWDGYDHSSFKEAVFAQTGIRLHAEALVSDHAAAQQIVNQSGDVDVLNINNPYPKKVLYPAGRIHRLDASRLPSLTVAKGDWMRSLQEWGIADDGSLIGVCQRFGSFNLVINNRKVSHQQVSAAGFTLPAATNYKMPYGILQFPEFNIFHICIAAGLNPFTTLESADLDAFSDKAESWFSQAAIVTEDSAVLNRALVAGDISFYLSGGIFTAGAVRLEGHHHIQCVTPESGPIQGKGAISFVEVNALTKRCRDLDAGYDFLNQILEPQRIVQIATNPHVCNPVIQMLDRDVFPQLSTEFLNAIQWETLEEDIKRCAIYDIPPQFPELLARLTRVCGGVS